MDGSDTDRSLAAGLVCRARERCPAAFRTYRPEPARVALVFDFNADMYSEMEDAEDISRAGTVCYRYKESLKGYYSLLWRLGLAVDLVPLEYLERIGNYSLVMLPYLHILSESQAGTLKDYVGSGGVLVSDPGLAFRDDRAWVNRVLFPNPAGAFSQAVRASGARRISGAVWTVSPSSSEVTGAPQDPVIRTLYMYPSISRSTLKMVSVGLAEPM